MASVDDTVARVADKGNELSDLFIEYFDQLVSNSLSAYGSANAFSIRTAPAAIYDSASPVVYPDNGVDISSLFTSVQNVLKTFVNQINSLEQPEPSKELGDALEGWNGVGAFPLWENTEQLLKDNYTEPLSATIVTLIEQLQSASVPDSIKSYLPTASAVIGNMLLSVHENKRTSQRFFEVPSVITQSTSSFLGRQISFQSTANLAFMQFVIESLAKDYRIESIKHQDKLDELQPRYNIIFGEIYTLMAGYIIKKANIEIDWFLKDYEARMNAQADNVQMNSDHYLKYIEDMIQGLSLNADLNIKAIVGDYTNVIKQLTHVADLAKAEFDIKSSYNEAALAIYGMTLNEIIGRFSAALQITLSDKTNAITNLGSLTKGYKALLGSYGQDVIGVVTSKQATA